MKTPIQLGNANHPPAPAPQGPANTKDERPAPTVYLNGPEFARLPEKGRITFEFVRRRVTADKEGDEVNATVVLALTCICEVKGAKAEKKKEKKTEDVLDELLKEAQEEAAEDESEEDEED